MQPSARILLLSTSTLFGGDYLDYAEDEIRDFLGATSQVLFLPFALHDHSAYAGRVRKRFTQMGYALESLHQATDAAATVDRAEAVFIGGGNTFRLLSRLYDLNLLAAIRDRVGAGMPISDRARVRMSPGQRSKRPTICPLYNRGALIR